jgi:hypothetical protein
MESAAEHLRVPQLQWDDIETVRFQKFDERRLISIDHDLRKRRRRGTGSKRSIQADRREDGSRPTSP